MRGKEETARVVLNRSDCLTVTEAVAVAVLV